MIKKILCILVSSYVLTSCMPTEALYTWNDYNATSYNYLKNTDEESTQELIENYQQIIEKQKGIRKTAPPGIYADYGFILLQTNKTEEGKAMLLKEIELYPESKIFIDRILKMIEE